MTRVIQELKILTVDMRTCAKGYRQLAEYQCEEAARTINCLPSVQLNTSWAMMCLGRCYFEMCKYNEASHYFEQVREVCPHQLEGLEIYSTILWHMKDSVGLTFL